MYLPRKEEVVEQTQEDGGPPSVLRGCGAREGPPAGTKPRGSATAAGGAAGTSDAASVTRQTAGTGHPRAGCRDVRECFAVRHSAVPGRP